MASLLSLSSRCPSLRALARASPPPTLALSRARRALATATPSAAAGASPSLLRSPRTVSIVGCGVSLGQPIDGVGDGPKFLRKGGLRSAITNLGWRVNDIGDLRIEQTGVYPEPNAKHSVDLGRTNHKLAQTVQAEARAGNFVLTLGGDHSLAIGSIAGIVSARPETGIVWVDAHADLNTHKTSFSGNIHGMSVGFLLNLDNTQSIAGFEWLQSLPQLSKEKIVYVGLRDVDPPEKRALRELGIKAFSMFHLDKYGIGKVMEMALDHVHDGKNPIHVSCDIDSVDPFLAPATGTKVRGGLTFREANYVLEVCHLTGMLGSMDMVEVNPYLRDQDVFDDTTVETALSLVESALGKTIL